MYTRVPIGEFSRATKLSITTLRHYHQVGLLEPTEIDPDTGYRYYSDQQLRSAQIIRRLRDLKMPVAEVKAVLTSSDPATRNRLIIAHLDRLEAELAATRAATTDLRALLDPPQRSPGISAATIAAATAIAIEDTVDYDDLVPWWKGALAELHAHTDTQELQRSGPPAGLYAAEIFQNRRGVATVYIPVSGTPVPSGRASPRAIPAVDLAVLVHHGSLGTSDVAYSQLASHVLRHEISVDGPIHEYYLTGYLDTRDPSRWKTEIGWPIFRLDPGTNDDSDGPPA